MCNGCFLACTAVISSCVSTGQTAKEKYYDTQYGSKKTHIDAKVRGFVLRRYKGVDACNLSVDSGPDLNALQAVLTIQTCYYLQCRHQPRYDYAGSQVPIFFPVMLCGAIRCYLNQFSFYVVFGFVFQRRQTSDAIKYLPESLWVVVAYFIHHFVYGFPGILE